MATYPIHRFFDTDTPPPRAHMRPMTAAACSVIMRLLLPGAVATMMMSAAFGIALAQGTWATAQLSENRTELAATSVGNMAIFAGGKTDGPVIYSTDAVDLYNSVTGNWSTAQLSVARNGLAATSVGTVAIFAGGMYSTYSTLGQMLPRLRVC
jgi:hypothetical protein